MSTKKQTKGLRERKGFTIFADLIWILVFCLCAILIFFFLYKPLVDDMIQEKAKKTIAGLEILPVYSDTQYVALGLSMRRAQAGASGQSRTTFAGIIESLAGARKTTTSTSQFDTVIERSGYVQTLNTVFGQGSPFWTESAYQRSDGTRVRERQRVAVIIYHQGAWLSSTCQEYTATAGLVTNTRLCNRFSSNVIVSNAPQTASGNTVWGAYGQTVTDPDTGITIPVFTNTIVETGSIHIPSTNGPATLFVFIAREEEK